jgi:hypothetical protein
MRILISTLVLAFVFGFQSWGQGFYSGKKLSSRGAFTPESFAQSLNGMYSNEAMFSGARDSIKSMFSRRSLFVIRQVWARDTSATWVYFSQYLGTSSNPIMSWLYEIKPYSKDTLIAKMYFFEGTEMILYHDDWLKKEPFGKLQPRKATADMRPTCELFIVRQREEKTVAATLDRAADSLLFLPRFANQQVEVRCLEQDLCTFTTIVGGAKAIQINFVMSENAIFSNRTLYDRENNPIHKDLKIFERLSSKKTKIAVANFGKN